MIIIILLSAISASTPRLRALFATLYDRLSPRLRRRAQRRARTRPLRPLCVWAAALAVAIGSLHDAFEGADCDDDDDDADHPGWDWAGEF